MTDEHHEHEHGAVSSFLDSLEAADERAVSRGFAGRWFWASPRSWKLSFLWAAVSAGAVIGAITARNGVTAVALVVAAIAWLVHGGLRFRHTRRARGRQYRRDHERHAAAKRHD